MHTLKILIVEDDQQWSNKIRTTLLDHLSGGAYAPFIEQAYTAEDGKRMVRDAATQDSPYDLVSLDMHLANPEGQSGSGMDVLGTIAYLQAAWMVSILTGVERDATVEESLGEETARKLREELRSSAYKKTFPPERLLIQEKPDLKEDELIEARLRDVCTILKQSLAAQNLFELVEIPCEVPKYQLLDGSWVTKDSKEHKDAKKQGQLVKAGKVTQNAQWFPDVFQVRQIRFGCGTQTTVNEYEDFPAIAAALAAPGKLIDATSLEGEFAPHEFDGAELAKNKDVDYEADQASKQQDWDTTEADSYNAYREERDKLKRQLEVTQNPRDKERLEETISDYQQEMDKLRRKPVPVIPKGVRQLGQSKTRVISYLKQNGQVALAKHIEEHIRVKGNTLIYRPDQPTRWII